MRSLTLLLAALALCGLAHAKNNQTYSSLKPNTYGISLSYVINGVESSPAPCSSNATLNAEPCTPPVLNANSGDQVLITYFPLGDYAPPVNSTVGLKACFSNETSVNRKWRKRNDIIHKDRRCPTLIKKGLSPTNFTFAYTIGPNTPPATFSVQLLENCGTADVPVWCGLGQSKGFYSVVPIESRPGWLVGLTVAFMCCGPLALVVFFVVERKMKKEQ